MPKPSREYFGEWFDRTLANENIAGGEVARALNVNDSTVSRWRNGKGTPDIDKCAELASFLGVNFLALAVTAGRLPAKQAGVQPLPLPDDSARQDKVREQIKKIRGLTPKELEVMLNTYDRTRKAKK